MHEKIVKELTAALDIQARNYTRIEMLRTATPLIEHILATEIPLDAYWSVWSYYDMINAHLSLTADSILFDSPVAALLEGLESIVQMEFKSEINSDGDVLYFLTTPERINLRVLANLTETGTCRKVVRGYEKHIEPRFVDVETATPIYGLVCGGEDV